MYITFYGLRKEPFHITPDPEFLFLSPSHKEALAAIIYGIEQKKGFVAIIGDVGVGKTTVLRSYLDSADRSRLKVIYVFNAKLTFEGLLKTIFHELDIEVPSSDQMEMVNKLYEVLIEEYKHGNNVVLVIDEAQNMPIETLENLRMLSNLETPKDKLIQIILVGQNEFEEKLNLNRLRQFKQRIAILSRILPLTKSECFDYVKFRIQKAGSNCGLIFTNSAVQNIINESKGIPRVLNILCDNALITGLGYQQRPVNAKVVKEVIDDFRGKKGQPFIKWKLASSIAVIIIAIGVFVISPYFKFVVNWFSEHQQTIDVSSSPKSTPISVRKDTSNISSPKRQIESTQVTHPSPSARTESDSTVRSEQIPERSVAKDTIATPEKTIGTRKSGQKSARTKSMNTYRTKVVQKGDALSSLLQEEYRHTDPRLIESVKETNPQIVNPDLIMSGSKIVLPASPEGRQGDGQ